MNLCSGNDTHRWKAVWGGKPNGATVSLRSRALVAALVLVAGLLPTPVAAQHVDSHRRLDSALDDAADTATIGAPGVRRVIIRAVAGASAQLRAALVASGHSITADLNSIESVAVDLSTTELDALTRNPLVASLSSNADVRATQVATTIGVSEGSGLLRDTLGLTAASPQGRGVGVAIIDSGIRSSLEFDERIVAFYDFTSGGVATAPSDDYGHGTHVAGLIGATGAFSSQYRGVAPSAHLIGLKVLDANGAGKTSDVIAAIEFAIAHRADLGIDVINLSLGHPIFESANTDPLVQTVERAVRAGI